MKRPTTPQTMMLNRPADDSLFRFSQDLMDSMYVHSSCLHAHIDGHVYPSLVRPIARPHKRPAGGGLEAIFEFGKE